MNRPCEGDVKSGTVFLYAQILFHFSARKIYALEHPAEPPLRPVCIRSSLRMGCPYPANGFLCWRRDRKCLRSEVRWLSAMDRWAGQKTKEEIHTDESM